MSRETRPRLDARAQLNAVRLVAQTAAVPMAVVSSAGEFLVVNDAYAAFVQRPLEDLERGGLADVTHPEDFERDRDAMAGLGAGTLERYVTEKRYLRPDGSVVWGIIAATPVRGSDGVIGSFSIVQDITARVRAQEALRVSEEHLRQVLANAPIGMGLLDTQGRWQTVNQALCEITGRSEHELIGHSFTDVSHPDDVAEDPREIAALVAGDLRASTRRKRYIRGDGTVIWVQVHRAMLFDADGVPMSVIGQVEDITDRVSGETALRHSADRLRRLAEAAKDFVVFRYRMHPDPGYEYVSPSVESLTGYTPQEFYNDPYLTYRIIHPEDAAKLQDVRDPVDGAAVPQTLRAFHRNGRLLHTEQRSVPIHDDTGRQVGFDAIVVDVTARVEAEQRLRSRERHFRSLVENSSDMIFITDAEGVLTHATPPVKRVLGYAPEEVIGRSRFEFFHPDEVDQAVETFRGELARPGTSITIELRVRDAWGAWRWLECTATNLLADPDVQGIILNARDVSERHNLHEQLARHANLDGLTGLVNWRRFMELVAQRTDDGEAQHTVGVLVLGLNRFGAINDTLGYEYGDRLLQGVADRLQAFAPRGMDVARGGGKRFAMLFDTTGEDDLVETAEAVLSLFDEPFIVDGQPVQVDATGGAALYPADGTQAELLLRRAEVARRRARVRGAPYTRYTTGLHAPVADQIRFLGQLRDAIGAEQLVLHYQPKVAPASRLVDGAEALVRWQHPQEGWVQPAQFIPLAEESGLIRPLTRWVATGAVAQAQRWLTAGFDLPVAINVTTRNLQDPTFVDTIAATLEDAGATPDRLGLELTERSVMTDPVAATETCRLLSRLGVRLSLDDFGTGHSALAYLVSLPIDEIKIDRTFVAAVQHQAEARAVVRAIVQLATDLGKDVIAEGVEDAATAEVLMTLGCLRMQGYLYGRPVPVDEIQPWVERGGWITSAGQPPGQ